jgi:hypothetical protein
MTKGHNRRALRSSVRPAIARLSARFFLSLLCSLAMLLQGHETGLAKAATTREQRQTRFAPSAARSPVSSDLAGTPVYALGDIPPQHVRQGATLQFQVISTQPGTATFSYTFDSGYPTPQGALSLNPNSGLFIYQPADADKFEIGVRIACAINGVAAESQPVSIIPLAQLPPEGDLLLSPRPLPDLESRDYQVVSQSLRSTPELFNGVQQPVRNVEVSGKRVVFAADDSKNTLYTRFNGATDIENFSVYAETVVIRSLFKLPGANVTIYARELRFEAEAALDTTPKGYVLGAAQFANGLPGQKGGDITLRVQSFYTAPGTALRLITRGGDGQRAGEGRPGHQGTPTYTQPPPLIPGSFIPLTPASTKPYSNLWVLFNEFSWLTAYPGPIIRATSWEGCKSRATDISQGKAKEVWGSPYPQAIYIEVWNGPLGSRSWPGDGENGVPGGKPGNGGAGGAVRSNLAEPASVSDPAGGNGGPMANPQPGGAAGQPTRAVTVTSFASLLVPVGGGRFANQYFYCADSEHTSRPGLDFVPAPADVPVGVRGGFTQLSGPDAQWLHPAMLRMVVAHLKDAYINGNLDYARDVIGDYLNLLDNYAAPDDNAALQIAQMRAELEAYRQNLSFNLDYFGHPAGWVPLLSLEANMTAFNSEIDPTLQTLYLSYWLENKVAANQKDVQAIRDSMAGLDQAIAAAAQNANGALQAVPNLQGQADEISRKVQLVEAALQQREDELEKRARDNVADRHKLPAWKNALRVIATAAKLAPVKTPVFGAIGTGLDILTNIDSSRPLDAINQLSTVEDTYKKSAFPGAAQQLKDFLDGDLKKKTDETAVDYARRLGTVGKNLAPAIAAIRAEFATRQVDETEIEREFKRIRATDSEFNDLMQQVSELTGQKEAFAQALEQMLQSISTLTNQIGQNLLTIGAMYRQLDPAVAQVDHSTLQYVREMGREARERLLRYQYYMAKSYEYRMLRPYPGTLNLNRVADSLITMLGSNYTLSAADFAAVKAVYVASVRDIVEQGLGELEQRAPERSLPFIFELTAEELRRLNEAGAVDIDISTRTAGLLNEENRHISDLGVVENGMQVQLNQTPSSFGRVRVVFEHQGRSTETAGGHTYSFIFGSGPDDRPLTWGVSYDVLTGRVDREQLSVAGISLLRSLLGITAPADGDALSLFVRPGADAVITVRKFQDPQDMGADVTRLRMSVTVDFYRTTSSQVWLDVKASDGASPYIAVDKHDLTGRADGLGSFRRAYPQGTVVGLSAEPVYGSMTFQRWADGNGSTVSSLPSVAVTLNASRTVRPVYKLTTTPMPSSVSSVSGSGVYGGTAALTATLTSGGSPLSGKVITFKLNGSDFAGNTAVTNASGVAMLPAASLPGINAGTYSNAVAAGFAGDVNFGGSGSTGTLSVSKSSTLTTLSSSANPSASGQGVTFAVAVTSATGTPSGTVQLKADGVNAGAPVPLNSNGVSTFTIDGLVVGAHTVSADYGGDANFNVSTGTLAGGQVVSGVFEFSQGTFSVAEGGGSAVVTVTRTGDISRAMSVNYATDDGAIASVAVPCQSVTGLALERCDYTRAAGTLRFAAGDTQKTFAVLINDDSYTEGTETARLRLSNPVGGASLGQQSSAALQILDDAQQVSNPLDDAPFYVRQHYHDFLNREPDTSGLAFWVKEMESCGSNRQCRDAKRVNVSAAFFLSIEFQETGYLVERMYKSAYGDSASPNVSIPVPVIRLDEFLNDTQTIGQGVVVGQGNWQQQLKNNQNAFALEFVSRQRFTSAYPSSLTAGQFVARLNANAGGILGDADLTQLEAVFGGPSASSADAAKRAQALLSVAENPQLRQSESNRAFVLMQYFGYLRRNPDDTPDGDFRGWKFWLDKLEQFHGDFVSAEMVKAFLDSLEYRRRFGQ